MRFGDDFRSSHLQTTPDVTPHLWLKSYWLRQRRCLACRICSPSGGASAIAFTAAVEPHVVEPAPKSIKCAVATIEKVVPVEPAPKVERKPRLAQAFPGVPQRGRGAGRRFTKVTAVGAAVARAQHLTPERRREIALAASAARRGRA